MSNGDQIAVVVADIVPVADKIRRLRLVPADGGALPQFSAGSHIVVTMNDGHKRIKNPYSLMGSLDDTSGYEISVLRTEHSHGGSAFIHERLKIGDALSIGHPSNLFPIDLRAKKHLLIAGGIGITPIMTMAEQLARVDAPFELHYATRQPESGAYIDLLKERYSRNLHHYLSCENQRIDCRDLLSKQPLGTHLYVCGPSQMIDDVLDIAKQAGWPDQNVHAEHFTTPRGGKPFDVVLAKSGQTIHVQEDTSILQAIEESGLEPPYLCRGGACGQCETAVVACDGGITHYDHYLTDDEKKSGKKIMICVSRIGGAHITLDM